MNYTKTYLNLEYQLFIPFASRMRKKLKSYYVQNSECLTVIVYDDRPINYVTAEQCFVMATSMDTIHAKRYVSATE